MSGVHVPVYLLSKQIETTILCAFINGYCLQRGYKLCGLRRKGCLCLGLRLVRHAAPFTPKIGLAINSDLVGLSLGAVLCKPNKVYRPILKRPAIPRQTVARTAQTADAGGGIARRCNLASMMSIFVSPRHNPLKYTRCATLLDRTINAHLMATGGTQWKNDRYS